jgi:hypothetical protein
LALWLLGYWDEFQVEAVFSDNVLQPMFSGNRFPTGGFKETDIARMVQGD